MGNTGDSPHPHRENINNTTQHAFPNTIQIPVTHIGYYLLSTIKTSHFHLDLRELSCCFSS